MSKMKKRADGLYQMILPIIENGRTARRKYFYGHTQAECRAKMMAYKQKQNEGHSFLEAADGWEKAHFRVIADGTAMSYAPALKRAREEFGASKLSDIRPLDIRRSLEIMAAQDYAHHSVAIYLSVLRQIFDYAVLYSLIDVNPVVAVKIPKGLKHSTRQVPTAHQIQAIRDHVDDDFGLFAFLLLNTGLRRGEALALQWGDISFANRRIRVSKSASYAGGRTHPLIKCPKTESGVREVVMPDQLVLQLWPIQGKATDYLFGGSAPLTSGVYAGSWKRYCIGAGLADPKGNSLITPHQLRHAYATMLFEAGIDAKDAQHLLGHSKIDVTLDTYTHIRQKRMDDVAARINSFSY